MGPKASSALAVILAASLPTGAFAQNYAASRGRFPTTHGSGASSPYGSVAALRSYLGSSDAGTTQLISAVEALRRASAADAAIFSDPLALENLSARARQLRAAALSTSANFDEAQQAHYQLMLLSEELGPRVPDALRRELEDARAQAARALERLLLERADSDAKALSLTRQPLGLDTVSDASRSEPTKVAGVVQPRDERELLDYAQDARRRGLKLSVSGARHSQGGQIVSKDSLHINMDRFRQSDPRDANLEYRAAWDKAAGPLTQEQRRALQGYKVLFVKGLLADVYLKAGRQYFDASLKELQDSGIDAERIDTNSQRSPEENLSALAAAIESSDKPVFLVSHSMGGLISLHALLDRPELQAKVKGWAAIQTPFFGSPVADWILGHKHWRWKLRKLLEIFNGSESALRALAVAGRRESMSRRAPEIAALARGLPIISLATWKERGSWWRLDTLLKLTRDWMLKSLGLRGDGLVDVDSAVLPGSDFAVVEGIDHAAPVMPAVRPFDRARLTRALMAMLLARADSDFEPWIASERNIALERMLVNISPAGAARGSVAASPSRENPNYWYHWKRDAALTMAVIVNLYVSATEAVGKQRYFQMLTDYADFTQRVQNTWSITGEGEPKVNMDGSAFNDPWSRPQNDGPAEEADTLIAFLNALPQQQQEFGRRYYGDSNIGIKKTLEYVSHNWDETNFDLWEEVKGLHFETLMTQRTALLEGAVLARKIGDGGAADWYQEQARLIEAKMAGYWDPRLGGYIVATLNRDEGSNYKSSGLDSAVIIAVVHRRIANDAFFSVTDERVLATAQALKQKFKAVYPINQRTDIPGTAIGRYPEDQYFGGNPWVIPTHAFAQLYYTAAKEFRKSGFIDVTPVNLAFFKDLLKDGAGRGALRAGVRLGAGDALFNEILQGLQEGGDDFLRRIKFHANSDGSLSEQMDKNSGFMISARDLTWNYASFLSAIQARDDLLKSNIQAREARRYLAGRVYDPGVIAQEKADGRFTAVFDLNDTLEHHDAKDPDAIHLRPGVEKDLARLRESGAKVVLWSQAEKWWIEKFFDKFPGIAPLFDRIVTAENYMAMTAAEKDALPATAARIAADHNSKDLSVLGYDLIVDDRAGLSATANDAGFLHLQIPPLRPAHPEGQRLFSEAVEEVLALVKVRGLRRTPDGDEVAILDLKKDRALIQSSLGPDPLVFAINRSIFSLEVRDSGARIARSAGGAAPAIYGALKSQGSGIVFSAAMTPAEKALARYGKIIRIGEGVWLRYIDVPADVFEKHYTGFSNSILWPVQHGMAAEFFEGAVPEMRAEFEQGYRRANALFAREMSSVLGEVRGRLMIQDYHLYLLPAMLRAAKGASGVIQQFVHIPWPEPRYIESLISGPVLRELLEGILGNDIIGFQTPEYASNFMKTAERVLGARIDASRGVIRYGGRETWVRDYPISLDVDAVLKGLRTTEARDHMRRLETLKGGRSLILRVDRMDPTKGILEGFAAFRRMLRAHPELRRRTVFYAVLQPSREANSAYRGLQDRIREQVREINREFSPEIVAGGWDGIVRDEAGYREFLDKRPSEIPVVVAQLTGVANAEVLADMAVMNVGLVNSKADGMNLVAKEMAVANDPRLLAELGGETISLRPGVIIASTRMGAFRELAGRVIELKDPNDVAQTAKALHDAILASRDGWGVKAAAAAGQVRERDLKAWLDAMLGDVQARAPPARPAAWMRTAQTLTAAATVAFLLVHIPQISSNIGFLLAGFPEKLSSLPWMAYTIGIFNNLLLLFDIVAKKAEPVTERAWPARAYRNIVNWSDALMQLSGIVTASLVLGTLYAAYRIAAPGDEAQALLMPGWAFWAMVPVLTGGLWVSYLKWKGILGGRAWELVKGGTEVLVLSSLTQAFWTLATGSFAALLPAALAAAAGVAWLGLETAGRLPNWLPKAARWSRIMFWTRLGVAAYGLPALAVQNWAHPQNIAGVSLPSLLLGMWGNLLSLPQAILSKNKVWIFNSVFGGIAASGLVLAVMWYFGALSLGALGAVAVLAAAFVAFTFWQSRRQKN